MASNDIVLIDSSDEGEQQPRKITKLNNSDTLHNQKEPLFKRSWSSSAEPDSENADRESSAEEREDGDDMDESDGWINQVDQATGGGVSGTTSSDSDSDSDLEEISPDEYEKHNKKSQEQGSSDSSRYPSVITKEACSNARRFLKIEGSMAFLDKYLPVTAEGEDIIYLIRLLGYYPKSIVDYRDEDNLVQLVNILQKVMNKVMSMRTRLGDFNTFEQAVEVIRKSSRILVITGAGISTSLGIPDFRSSKGFYSQLQHLGLSDPQEVFDLSFFKYDPSIFYSIAHMILPPDSAYTPLHAFIKKLQDKGKLLRNYTQNIDNLEGNAGIQDDKLIQCHGSFAYASCTTCKARVKGEVIFPEIRKQELPICPHCRTKRDKMLSGERGGKYLESYGVMKPDITFFGEALPKIFHDSIRQDLSNCDLLICIGTSLKVAPVSEIVNKIPNDVPQLLINMDMVTHCEFDVSLLGYCDEVATYLSDKLGWELDHKDFSKIKNSGLSLVTVEKNIGVYEIGANLEEN